jgi:hypothetical protein
MKPQAFYVRWFWYAYWYIKTRRVGRCARCNQFKILVHQNIAYSTSYAWLCVPDADDEQKEVEQAWRDYYSSVL